jgi:hypothetical protein
MMRVLGVVALLFVVIGGLMPSEIEYQAPAGSLNLPFDDVEAAPRVAEITCNCATCLESKTSANYVNQVEPITPPEEQINSGRRAACVNYTLNSRSTDLDRPAMLEHPLTFWCNCNRSHGIQSGRFSGAAA